MCKIFNVGHLHQNKKASCGAFLFCSKKRIEQDNAQHRNSPVDCFGVRVRVGERRSEPSDSRHLHHLGH